MTWIWWLSILLFVPTVVFKKPLALLWIIPAWLYILFIVKSGIMPDYSMVSWWKFVFAPVAVWHALIGVFGYFPLMENYRDSGREYMADEAMLYFPDLIGGVAAALMLAIIF
ncbi:MAG: hypothetical protein ACM3KR_11460 [Deltaproteobacteria bacterium]